MQFIKLIKHQLQVLQWLISPQKNSLDYMAQSFMSIATRWHGEIDPVMSYIGMFDFLRQNKFSGEFVEFGGGYSTILAQIYLDNTNYKSVDVYPQKYYRILNSVRSTNSFLEHITRIDRLTVMLSDVDNSLIKIKEDLASFNIIDVKSSLERFCKSQNGDVDSDAVNLFLTLIFDESNHSILNFYKDHESYKNEIPFYKNHPNDIGFCNELKIIDQKIDAIFYDCGEISSVAEWMVTSDLISVGGYGLFHDIFFPKSIKNFLICTYIDLSPNWNIVYLDDVSVQGSLMAQRVASDV